MITDEVKINIHAGKGGDGIVAFSKIKMTLGPTGGKGGRGGNVYFMAVDDLTALNQYRQKKEFWAEDGRIGKGNKATGLDGKDLVLNFPLGSVFKNLLTDEIFELTKKNEKVLVIKGGSGGRGNFYFRSSKNTSPKKFEKGLPGESAEFFVELRLIASIGLVGLPNAGKSSLLNELTKAEARVGNYEFTTLEPNLGSMDGLIIADIPGLIEGASSGKGLGIKFLKHIRRTKILAHCIPTTSENLMKDYKIIRKELGSFSKELLKKNEIILITKSDLVSNEELDKKIKEMKKINPQVLAVSIHDFDSINSLKKRFQLQN
jgi:GTPase